MVRFGKREFGHGSVELQLEALEKDRMIDSSVRAVPAQDAISEYKLHALSLAISDRALNGKMVVVESLDLSEAKTKLAKQMLEALGLKHALIVLAEDDQNFYRAARNLAAHKVLSLAGLNVYDVLNHDELLMTTKVARAIEARFQGAAQ